MSGVSKVTADRNQRILLDLVSKSGNDVCADCKARLPRWASHNLGVFLCMNCASIHRKIGTHITKVKSVTMDSWSKEQVEVMKSVGNLASNAKYNPNEIRHPPPTNREESERDSELEKFIRNKYEFKRFMEKPSAKPSSSSVAPPTRARSTPARGVARRPSPPPTTPIARVPTQENRTTSQGSQVSRSLSASLAIPSWSQPAAFPPPASPATTQSHVIPTAKDTVWEDIMSLSGPSVSPMVPPRQHPYASSAATGTPHTTSPPANPFPSTLIQQQAGGTASLPFMANTPTFIQSQSQQPPSMANPFNVSQQPAGFTSQLAGTTFQVPMQSQPPFSQTTFSQPSFGQSPFAQPSHPPFAQAGQPSRPISYTTPSSFPQMPLPPQFVPSPLPNTQLQLVQGGNPAGTWQQQQPGLPGHQQPVFFTQPTGFAARQQYGA